MKTKKLALYIAFAIFCLPKAEAQHTISPDATKYRINLPSYWKPGNRVWKILTDKLPLVCEELKDKELCGDDCNAKYVVDIEMSDPAVFDYYPAHVSSTYTNIPGVAKPSETWDIKTQYGFECSLLLKDERGTIITRFVLVDFNETWQISRRVTFDSYAPAPVASMSLSRDSYASTSKSNNQQSNPLLGQEGETTYSFINKNKEKLAPTERDMFTVIDMKINSL